MKESSAGQCEAFRFQECHHLCKFIEHRGYFSGENNSVDGKIKNTRLEAVAILFAGFELADFSGSGKPFTKLKVGGIAS